MRYFKMANLEKAVRETYLEVVSGEIKHQKVVEVRSVSTGKVTMGQVEK